MLINTEVKTSPRSDSENENENYTKVLPDNLMCHVISHFLVKDDANNEALSKHRGVLLILHFFIYTFSLFTSQFKPHVLRDYTCFRGDFGSAASAGPSTSCRCSTVSE